MSGDVEYVVDHGMLCEVRAECTCAAASLPPGYSGHENGCGTEPLCSVEELADHFKERPCTCYPGGVNYETYEGPQSWCDQHGLPSAAWDQGYDAGRNDERALAHLTRPDGAS